VPLPTCWTRHRAETAWSELDPVASAPFAEPVLDDAFRSPWLETLRAAPFEARCVASLEPREDRVSDWLQRAAAVAGHPAAEAVPLPGGTRPDDLDVVLEALAEAFAEPVRVASRDLSPELEAAIASVLWPVLDAVQARDAAEDPVRGATWWARHGGNGLLPDPDADRFDAAHPSDRAFLEASRSRTYGAAVRIARAVEAVPWGAGATDGGFDATTPRGRIRVAGTGPDDWTSNAPHLLSVDLGGDDVYTGPVGGSVDGRHPVSVHVDVAGDDLYTYPEALSGDATSLPLPSDAAGRFDRPPDVFGASASDTSRQGAGRAGIGMLFDLSGDDRYRALRASQGYAHHGVGVLFDAQGDDDYRLEDAGQGAAQFGIGLAIDLDGHDRRHALSRAQGLGFVGGVGVSVDRAGHDVYRCARAPVIHPAPQDPDSSNVSLCQGAGFGWRHDDPAYAMSGGLGWLVDRRGADRYTASVFAQGIGYWQGIGVLHEAAGDDAFDAAYYAQGSGLHFGAGVLVDDAGDDRYGASHPAPLSNGTGHDYGLGALFDARGDDEASVAAWGGGGGSCGGQGLRVDEAGTDRYRGPAAALGAATSEACPGRPSRGLFWDGGGADDYGAGGDSSRRDGARWATTRGDGAEARGSDVAAIRP